jgi:hypothetical protein
LQNLTAPAVPGSPPWVLLVVVSVTAVAFYLRAHTVDRLVPADESPDAVVQSNASATTGDGGRAAIQVAHWRGSQ